MNKHQILQAINQHTGETLTEDTALTKPALFDYLCELEQWVPLQVIKTSHPDWYLVASKSEIGLWHKTSPKHEACDCHRTANTRCVHLWAAKASSFGFTVKQEAGIYHISDNGRSIAEITFNAGQCVVRDRGRTSTFANGNEAIEYLAAVASFGSQLG